MKSVHSFQFSAIVQLLLLCLVATVNNSINKIRLIRCGNSCALMGHAVTKLQVEISRLIDLCKIVVLIIFVLCKT